MERERIAEVRERAARAVGIEPVPSAAGEPRRSAVPLRTGGGKPTLFLVPGQLGQIFHFKRVAERLRDDIPLVGLEAPGLYGDRQPIDDMTELAAHFISELRELQPHGPHLLGGFSAGAQIAYEMAAQLEAKGDPPHLLLFDYGPGYADVPSGLRATLLSPFHWVHHHWTNYWGLEGQRRAAYRRGVITQQIRRNSRRLGFDPDGWAYQKWTARHARDAPDRVELPGHAAVRSALRTAGNQWEWGRPAFGQPFTVFRAKVQRLGSAPDEFLGFDDATAPGGVDVRHVPGMHEYLFIEPHLFSLIPEVEDWVDRVTAETAMADRSAEDHRTEAGSVVAGGGFEPPTKGL